jgi:cell division protein FtsA
MAQQESKQMIVGLDIGTSKVVAVVGEIDPDGGMEVVGIGSHPSRGMKKGVVVNIESTVNAIQRAVEEAELMAGCQIHSVYVGIAGSHIRSVNSHGIVAIRDQEVFEQDIDRVIDAAQAVADPSRPEGIARAPAGVRHRQPVRDSRAAGNVRGPSGGQSAPRNLRRERGTEHRKVY